MSKILITGSSGFLGKHLVPMLSITNELYTLSRVNSNYSVDLSKDVPIFNEKYDTVIHAAGFAHKINNESKNIFIDINVTGTLNLLRGLEISVVPSKFVFISSVSVYGLVSGYNIDESSELLAKDPYGLSKIEAEKIILDWCNNNNVICTILRLPLIAGIDPPGNLGLMINSIKKGFYFNIENGKSKKSMVLANDVAKYILIAAEVGGVYNLTDGHHPSFYELSNYISKQLKKKPPKNLNYLVIKFIALIGDLFGSNALINSIKLRKITSNLTFDDTKAREIFLWNPTPILKDFKISDN
jgi:nucleoside-diphosphate-sugar epimerase